MQIIISKNKKIVSINIPHEDEEINNLIDAYKGMDGLLNALSASCVE